MHLDARVLNKRDAEATAADSKATSIYDPRPMLQMAIKYGIISKYFVTIRCTIGQCRWSLETSE